MRSISRLPILAMTLVLLFGNAAQAVVQPKEVMPAQSVLTQVGVDQKLGAQLPLDLPFRDEAGNEVKLAQYFSDGKPVVLLLVYYGCPSLCTMTLNGATKAFKAAGPGIGTDYRVVTVSFDPTEKPDLAADKKKSYIELYGRAGAEAGWHFLTGLPESIKKLTEAVGYRYAYDPISMQYAHGSAMMVLTPTGTLSRYLYGIDHSPKDLRLALVDASDGKVGTLADQVLMLCYQYDPTSGKYGFAVMTAIRTGGLLTLAVLGTFIGVRLRRDFRKPAGQTVDQLGSSDSRGAEPT